MSRNDLWKISRESTKPHISINQDKATCGICHRQISRYTCPSCNVPYCSLTCFRSDAHAQCSEPFYKRELEDGIKSQPNASMAERAKMMELLKKFEEEGDGNIDELGDENGEEGEEEEDGLSQRLAGVDLENISSEDLWARLTPAERSVFLKTVEDPRSEAAQALLRSKELENDLSRSAVLPWWEAQLVDGEDDETKHDDSTNDHGRRQRVKKFGEEPQVVQMPVSMLKVPSVGKEAPSLIYNICAVMIAYAYVTRHLAFSPLAALAGNGASDEAQIARKLSCSLLPFLTQKDARLVYSNLSEIITNLWAKLVASNKVSKEVFSLLLQDAALLLQPKKVLEVKSIPTTDNAVDLRQNASLNMLRVLSDLMHLFTNESRGNRKSETHGSLKLRFYAAHVVLTGDSTGDRAFAILSNALKERAEKILIEGPAEEPTGIRVQ